MNLPIEIILVALGWSLIFLPGTLLGLCYLSHLFISSRVVIGCGISFSLFVYIAYLDSYFLKLATITPWLWSTIIIGVLIHCRHFFTFPTKNRLIQITKNSLHPWIVALIALSSMLIRLIPLPCSLLPPGYDTKTHLFLARLIFEKNGIPSSWEPFEPISLNYPSALHNILALFYKLFLVDFTTSWKSLYPVFGTLAVLCIYATARLLFKDRRLSHCVAIVFSFGTIMGGLGYYAWGGMINQAGITLSYIVLLVVCEQSRNPTRFRGGLYSLGSGLLFTASYLIHHHVMLSGGIMLITVMLFAYIRDPFSNTHRFLCCTLIFSTLMGAFYLIPYALKIFTLTETNALNYLEPFFGPSLLFTNLGPVIVIFGLAGSRRFMDFFREQPHSIILVAFMSFFGIFIFIEYIIQGVYYILYHRPSTPLSPSRFLTNSVYFMAFPAAISAYHFFQFLFKKNRLVSILFVLALASQTVYEIVQLCGLRTSVDEYKSLKYIRDNTPQNSFIINQRIYWVNYFCWRETMDTAISSSEPINKNKKKYVQELLKSGNRPVYYIGNLPNRTPIFESGPYRIYRVN